MFWDILRPTRDSHNRAGGTRTWQKMPATSGKTDMGAAPIGVSRSYGFTQPCGVSDITSACALAIAYGIGAVFFYIMSRLIADRVKCLIPAYSLPLPFSAFTDSFQRIMQTIGVIDILEGGQALGTQGSFRR